MREGGNPSQERKEGLEKEVTPVELTDAVLGFKGFPAGMLLSMTQISIQFHFSTHHFLTPNSQNQI